MKSTFVKLVLAISIDGRLALAHGGKSHLGNKGDRRVLEKSLAWADATLMGGETLRIHKNTCLIHNEKLINERIKNKKPSQPTCIIISDQQNFSTDWLFFKQPIKRWLIGKKESTRNEDILKGFDRQLYIQSNWSKTLDLLSEKGIRNIVLLGGGKLVQSILEEDQIDELQLTITPRIIGGQYAWLPYQDSYIPKRLSESNSWILENIEPLEENEILVKYLRNHH